MKIVQIGLGKFGFDWLNGILKDNKSVDVVGLVDNNENILSKVVNSGEFSQAICTTNFEKALELTVPDFVLNVTPPKIHKQIVKRCIDYRIPVLCEKPIAETYDDALEMLKYSQAKGVPVMIAENYRYKNVVRKCKEMLSRGDIGRINSVQIIFSQHHDVATNYHRDLEHPLLIDVSIHHMDMLRYLTGAEAETVYAETWTPSWAWYKGFSDADLFITMEKKIKVNYRGSLSCSENLTGWLGSWRFEGEYGIIILEGNEITCIKNGNKTTTIVNEELDSRKQLLEEFIHSLKENRPGETDITDNIKTYEIVHRAIESINTNNTIKLV